MVDRSARVRADLCCDLIGHTGDIGRFPTKGHYAVRQRHGPDRSIIGTHRALVNPRGNWTNWAIHIVVVSQISHPGPGRDYYERKRDEGKSSKEAIRALKRRISDVIYRHLITDATRSTG